MTRLPGSLRQAALFMVLGAALTCAAQAASPTEQAAAVPGRAPSGTAASGKAVYEHWCAACHAPGPGHPGTQSLQLKYAGKLPAVLLERTDLSPQVVALFVRQGVLLMAPFRKTEITDAQLAALSAYVAANFKAP